MDFDLKKNILESDAVLVGIGEDFKLNHSDEKVNKALRKLKDLLIDKDCYFVSLEDCVEHEKIYYPIKNLGWDDYSRWLSFTLNRRLLVLELGVGLKYPDLIRFPFERIVYLNNKSILVRAHDFLYQGTSELGKKCISIPEDPVTLLIED